MSIKKLLLTGLVSLTAGAALLPMNVHAQESVSVYTSLGEEESAFYFEKFEEATGIKVNFVRLSAGETLARIEAEGDNPQASVWFGGSTDNYINAAEKGLLAEFQPEGVSELPEEYQDSEGYWTPIYVGALGFATNTESGIEAPTSWSALISGDYADNIVMAHPASSGTAYTVLATIIQLMGEDEGFAYMKELDANIRQYTKSGSAPAQQAGLGEAGVGISFAHDILRPLNEGYPIEISFPEEGTGYEVGATALIANGPEAEQEAAKQFIEWMISKEGQDLYAESDSFRVPMHPDAVIPEGSVALADLSLIDYDAQWAAENRDELLERFNNEVRGEEAAVE